MTSSRHESGVLNGTATDTVMQRSGDAAEVFDGHPLAAHWGRICGRLQAEVGEVEYHTWLRQMTLGPIDHDEITLYLPTRFLRDWVRSQYGDRLGTLWNGEIAAIRRVELMLSPDLRAPVASAAAPPPAPPSCCASSIRCWAGAWAASLRTPASSASPRR